MERALKECAAVSEQSARRSGRTPEREVLAGRGPLSGGLTSKQNGKGEKEEALEKAGGEKEEDSHFPEKREESMPPVGVSAEEKMEQFQEIMNFIIGRALDANNEKLSQDISHMVNEKVTEEMEYLFRVSDEKEEERFKQLDEIIRSYQKDNRGRAEAAAAKIPFFKKKRFGKKKATQG